MIIYIFVKKNKRFSIFTKLVNLSIDKSNINKKYNSIFLNKMG